MAGQIEGAVGQLLGNVGLAEGARQFAATQAHPPAADSVERIVERAEALLARWDRR